MAKQMQEPLQEVLTTHSSNQHLHFDFPPAMQHVQNRCLNSILLLKQKDAQQAPMLQLLQLWSLLACLAAFPNLQLAVSPRHG